MTRPTLIAVVIGAAFALAALIAGALGYGVDIALGVLGAHLVAWVIRRWNRPGGPFGALTFSFIFIAACDLGAYWIGEQIHGSST
ncbi:MAG: hypothetical protein AB7J28_07025 [Hyphomonadaceae bacterium]